MRKKSFFNLIARKPFFTLSTENLQQFHSANGKISLLYLFARPAPNISKSLQQFCIFSWNRSIDIFVLKIRKSSIRRSQETNRLILFANMDSRRTSYRKQLIPRDTIKTNWVVNQIKLTLSKDYSRIFGNHSFFFSLENRLVLGQLPKFSLNLF